MNTNDQNKSFIGILILFVIAGVVSAVWGLGQAPREYGLLLVVAIIAVASMVMKRR